MSARDETTLDVLTAGARRQLDAHGDELGPRPDFSDVVRRMGILDGDVEMGERIEQAEALSNVTPLRAEELRGTAAQEAALDDIVTGVRAAIDGHLAARRARGIPVFPRPGRASRWVVLGWAAAAAVVIIAGAAAVGIGGLELATEHSVQAPMISADDDRSSRAHPRDVVDAPAPMRAVEVPSDPPAPADTAGPGSTDDATGSGTVEGPAGPGSADGAEAVAPTVLSAARQRLERRPDAEPDRLEALDREARAAWRAGDLPRAEHLFRELVRLGGKTRHAELAYAELFALTHRASLQQRTRLWRGYLRRFPRGRFADDARAGICRAEPASAQAKCWQGYLRAQPDGTYRSEAERALASDEEP